MLGEIQQGTTTTQCSSFLSHQNSRDRTFGSPPAPPPPESQSPSPTATPQSRTAHLETFNFGDTLSQSPLDISAGDASRSLFFSALSSSPTSGYLHGRTPSLIPGPSSASMPAASTSRRVGFQTGVSSALQKSATSPATEIGEADKQPLKAVPGLFTPSGLWYNRRRPILYQYYRSS